MTKQTKRLITGTMILSFSGLFVKLINILYKLPLTNLVGIKTMGYFNTVYSIYLVLTAALLTGIPATISKLVAEEREAGNYRRAHQVFQTGFWLAAALGLIVSIAFVFLPAWAGAFAWEPETRYVLWGLALSPFLIGISGAIRGYFQGMQIMLPTAVSQIIENTGKAAIGVGLVSLLMKRGQPDYISVSGAAVGISVSFVAVTLYLLRQYRRQRPNFSQEADSGAAAGQGSAALLRKMVWIAAPITISSAMISIMGFIDSSTIYHLFAALGDSAENARMALSSVTTAQTVINVPLAVSAALAVSILPAVAVAGVRRDQAEMNDKINMGLQLVMKMGLPAMVGIFLLAEPILRLLYYKERIPGGLLQLYSICMLVMILAQSVSSILQGLSGYYKTLLAVLAAVVFKLAGNIVFLKAGLGAAALIWASILYFMVILGMNAFFLKRETGLHLNYGLILWRPLAASAGMGAAARLVYTAVMAACAKNAAAVLLAVAAAVPVYSLLMLKLRGFTAEEILILPRGGRILKYLQSRGWVE